MATAVATTVATATMTTRRRKQVMTTGDVARICHVAPRTVSKWFDGGHLKGYRIPGSSDRRIPIENLRKFMMANGLPMRDFNEEAGSPSVLIVSPNDRYVESVRTHLGGLCTIDAVTSPFAAGVAVRDLQPTLIVVDVAIGRIDAAIIAQSVRASNRLGAELVAVADDDEILPQFDLTIRPTNLDRLKVLVLDRR